ncbi:MAG: right-handed parallel beta-helix repeat-containing protein [Verrucomicrobiota bacterium]|nr:right-handed parallel beta-helix repeat-containing protein [Verrucomicrobiota bacterium]
MAVPVLRARIFAVVICVVAGGLAPLATAVARPLTDGAITHVYIAARNDGRKGHGTRHDPFDGSTQPKLEAIFQRYHDSETNSVHFHLAAGRYHLIGAVAHGLDHGRGGWAMRPGWVVQGAGKHRTTIFQDYPAKGDLGYGLFTAWVYGSGNQGVADLTIDCGFKRYGKAHPRAQFRAVSTSGDGSFVRNVRIRNAGGAFDPTNTGECFVVYITSDERNNGGAGDTASNTRVENTDIYLANSATVITIINHKAIETNANPVYGHHSRIVGNYIYCTPTANGAITEAAPAGIKDAVGAWNTLVNTSFYADTYPTIQAKIAHNRIRNGYMLFSDIMSDTTVSDNVVVASKDRGIQFSGSPNGISSNCIFERNRVIKGPGARSGLCLNNLSGSPAKITGLIFRDNVIDEGLVNGVLFNHGGTGVEWINNRTPTGELAKMTGAAN